MNGVAVDIIDTIVTNTYTVHDLERRLSVLRGCVEAALFTETELPYLEECALYLDTHASESDMSAITEWGDTVLNAFSQTNVRALMEALHTAAENLPVFILYVPCMFPDKEIAELSTWCRNERTPQTLLDVHVDASVVGGCGFITRDTYQEISLKTRMKASPHLITHLLSQYAQE